MRALIAGALWAAISVPLALLVARIMRGAGTSTVADEAERWLRARSISRRERWTAFVARSILAAVLLAPLAAAGAVAAWRLPSLMRVAGADEPTPPAHDATPWSTTPPSLCDHGTTSTTTPSRAREEPTAEPSCPDDGR